MRDFPSYYADVPRSQWQPIWRALEDANRDAVRFLKERQEECDKAERTPLIGKYRADYVFAASSDQYYLVERACWKAARELLLLIDRYAIDENKSHSQKRLNHSFRHIGRWIDETGPRKDS
jgi:hypothetical protein